MTARRSGDAPSSSADSSSASGHRRRRRPRTIAAPGRRSARRRRRSAAGPSGTALDKPGTFSAQNARLRAMTRPGTAKPAVHRRRDGGGDAAAMAHRRAAPTGTTTAMATTLATTPSHAVVHAGEASDRELVAAARPAGSSALATARHAHCAERDRRARQGRARARPPRTPPPAAASAERAPARLRRVAAAGAMVERPAEPAFDGDGGEGHDDEDRRGRERRGPIGEPGGVDDAGQRVEAEQLHGAELAEAVEQDDQHAAGDRTADERAGSTRRNDPHGRSPSSRLLSSS